MKDAEELIKSLPKDDYIAAKGLLKKKDYYNLGYLVWSVYSKTKSNPEDFNPSDAQNIKELNDMFSK